MSALGWVVAAAAGVGLLITGFAAGVGWATLKLSDDK